MDFLGLLAAAAAGLIVGALAISHNYLKERAEAAEDELHSLYEREWDQQEQEEQLDFEPRRDDRPIYVLETRAELSEEELTAIAEAFEEQTGGRVIMIDAYQLEEGTED